jgi:hypothetical protein
MAWSWIYTLTRGAVGLMTLRLRGEAAKDVELLVLRQALLPCLIVSHAEPRCRGLDQIAIASSANAAFTLMLVG